MEQEIPTTTNNAKAAGTKAGQPKKPKKKKRKSIALIISAL